MRGGGHGGGYVITLYVLSTEKALTNRTRAGKTGFAGIAVYTLCYVMLCCMRNRRGKGTKGEKQKKKKKSLYIYIYMYIHKIHNPSSPLLSSPNVNVPPP